MERVKITGVGSGMQGVGRLEEGCVAFVPGALPGEEVEIEITRRAQRFCEARLLRVCAPSPERRTPDCPAYGACGGCRNPFSAEIGRRIPTDKFHTVLNGGF